MSAKKTQCPFCESIFAVTPEQLSARGGHVRCGKCFQVFKADEHLVLPTPLGVSSAPVPQATAAADIFDFLDQPNNHDDESDTLAGQAALPQQTTSVGSSFTDIHVGDSNVKASDLGKLEQKTHLESDFDALFASLTPQPIDLSESYAQSAQSKLTGTQATVAAPPSPQPIQPRPSTPTPAVVAQAVPPARPAASLDLDLSPLDQDKLKPTGQFQDTPPPNSIAAVVLPPLGAPVNATKTGVSVFNKKQQTSAKLSSLKLDDELSELFLGDSGNSSAKKDILKHHDTASVDKLSSTADESWADALLQEEENAKKIAAEQQAAALFGSKKPPSVLKPSSAQIRTAASTGAIPPVKPPLDQSTHRSMAIEEDDLLSYLSQVGAASEKVDDRAGTQASPRAAQPQALPPPASHRIRVPVKPRQSTGHYVVWSVLCVLLLLLLLAQGLYFNFNNLATDPRHNSKLTAICAMIGCQVPSMDLTQISTGRVKLQRSPANRNTTRVTLNLTNQANNSQLIPKLKFLQLNNGQIEAYRLIEPHEYLQGNDRKLKQLLPRQSLRVEFDLNVARGDIKTYAVDPVY